MQRKITCTTLICLEITLKLRICFLTLVFNQFLLFSSFGSGFVEKVVVEIIMNLCISQIGVIVETLVKIYVQNWLIFMQN